MPTHADPASEGGGAAAQRAGRPFTERLADSAAWFGPGRSGWRAFALRALAAALAALVLYAGAAAAINPRGEFPWQLTEPALSQDAAYKRWLLDGHDEAPEVLVLGSSRSQKVAPADVEAASGLPAFNFALADGYPEDALTVYRGLRDQGLASPREILVGLDLNRLEPRGGVGGRADNAFGPLHTGGGPGDWWAATASVFSPVVAEEAAIAVAIRAGLLEPEGVTFAADGLAHYVVPERQMAAGTFDLNASLARTLGSTGPYPEFDGLDPRQVQAARDLVRTATADGVTVRLWLTPLHPALEQANGNGSYLDSKAEAVQLLQSLCGEGVHAHDYTRLESFGGDERAFFDAVHMHEANTQRVVAALYAGQGDLCAVA